MKKYNLSVIMKRAWELVKKEGKTISEGLKRAWAEAKAIVEKKVFESTAKVVKSGCSGESESDFLYFSRWQKAGHDRVYVNDYKRRTIGFFENGEFKHYDNQGMTSKQLDSTLDAFREKYAF